MAFSISHVDLPVKYYCVDLGVTEVNSGSPGSRSREEIEQLPLDYLARQLPHTGSLLGSCSQDSGHAWSLMMFAQFYIHPFEDFQMTSSVSSSHGLYSNSIEKLARKV